MAAGSLKWNRNAPIITKILQPFFWVDKSWLDVESSFAQLLWKKNKKMVVINFINSNKSCLFLSFQSFGYKPEWWMLFQKHVVHTKLDIYVFIGNSSLLQLHQILWNCQSCQIWPAKFGKNLIRTDKWLVFCNRKLMRTDIILTRTTKPICNFAISVTYL